MDIAVGTYQKKKIIIFLEGMNMSQYGYAK
jgi:hypothetical protein